MKGFEVYKKKYFARSCHTSKKITNRIFLNKIIISFQLICPDYKGTAITYNLKWTN